jgi:hypothetical protein
MEGVVIVAARRTAAGKVGGSLRQCPEGQPLTVTCRLCTLTEATKLVPTAILLASLPHLTGRWMSALSLPWPRRPTVARQLP